MACGRNATPPKRSKTSKRTRTVSHTCKHMAQKKGRFIPEDEIFHFSKSDGFRRFCCQPGNPSKNGRSEPLGLAVLSGLFPEIAPAVPSFWGLFPEMALATLLGPFPSRRQGVISNVSCVFFAFHCGALVFFFQCGTFSNASIGTNTSSNLWDAFLFWAVFFPPLTRKWCNSCERGSRTCNDSTVDREAIEHQTAPKVTAQAEAKQPSRKNTPAAKCKRSSSKSSSEAAKQQKQQQGSKAAKAAAKKSNSSSKSNSNAAKAAATQLRVFVEMAPFSQGKTTQNVEAIVCGRAELKLKSF